MTISENENKKHSFKESNSRFAKQIPTDNNEIKW